MVKSEKQRFLRMLKLLAQEINKPYEDRDENLEDGEIVWALRKAAELIDKFCPEKLQ